jgi:hypothetical protein
MEEESGDANCDIIRRRAPPRWTDDDVRLAGGSLQIEYN